MHGETIGSGIKIETFGQIMGQDGVDRQEMDRVAVRGKAYKVQENTARYKVVNVISKSRYNSRNFSV
jgi:hypothetical protein